MHTIPKVTATKSQKQVCIINLTLHCNQESELLKSIHYNYHYYIISLAYPNSTHASTCNPLLAALGSHIASAESVMPIKSLRRGLLLHNHNRRPSSRWLLVPLHPLLYPL